MGSPPPAAWKPTVEAHALHQASAPGVQARLRSPPGTSSSNPVAPPLTNCSLVTCKSSPAYEPDLQTLQIEQLEQAVPKHC